MLFAFPSQLDFLTTAPSSRLEHIEWEWVGWVRGGLQQSPHYKDLQVLNCLMECG